MNELRLASRRLGKRPAATLTSILTLSCAIGTAAATWSLLSAVLLHPLPIENAERLVVVGSPVGSDAAGTLQRLIYPYYPHLRDSGIFEAVVACWGSYSPLLVGAGDRAAPAFVAFASHDLLSVLGVGIPLGRGFTNEDDRRGAAPVVILTDKYWRRVFNSDPAVIGRAITVSGTPATIVGVSARGFRGLDLGQSPDLYLPLQTMGEMGSRFINYFADSNTGTSPTAGLVVIGRVPSRVSLSHALTRLATLGAPPGLQQTRPLGAMPINRAAIPASAQAGMAQFTKLLAITVGLLLLIGCASVGMLLLVRTEGRREEFAMCLALGASPGRLARGIAIEGAMLSAAGAVLAMPVTSWLLGGVRAFQLPGRVDIASLELSVDRPALLASAGAALIATMFIAAIAGWFGFSANLGDALRSRSGATPRLGRRRTRAALVAGQVAVALVLMAGAGLFARSLIAALSLNSDLGADRIITGSISLDAYGYSPARASAFFDDLLARLRQNPAVESMSYGVGRGSMRGKLTVDGIDRPLPSSVSFDAVDDRYFPTLAVRVLEGRDFSVDDRSTSPKVTIVSESFARLLASGGIPLGHRVTMPFHRQGEAAAVIEVVGVVPDVVTNVSALEPLAMYFPIAQVEAGTSRTVTVRAAERAETAHREIMSSVRALDPAVAPGPLMTLQQRIDAQMTAQRFGAVVLGALGVIAVLLTILGTYVLAESLAVLRMREMSIRAALGATGTQLGAIVLAETARSVGLGLVVGAGLAWLGASTIRAFLFQVQPLDPVTFGTVSALILFLAMVVSLRPAWRAARVDLARVLNEN